MGAKLEFLVEVAFGPAIVGELKFGGGDVPETGVEDAERVKVGDMVATDLLILFFSKSLLRHPLVKSDLSEMTGETHFQRYLPDPHPDEFVALDQVSNEQGALPTCAEGVSSN